MPPVIPSRCHIIFPNSITGRAAYWVRQLLKDNWAQVQMIRGRKLWLQYSETVAVWLRDIAVGTVMQAMPPWSAARNKYMQVGLAVLSVADCFVIRSLVLFFSFLACHCPMNRAWRFIPTSSIFFQLSGETHERSAVWALHTSRLLSVGLDRGGLALLADGIRVCLAWQGASIMTHNNEWSTVPNHTAKTIPSPSNTAAFAWKYCCRRCLGISPMLVLRDSGHCGRGSN